MKQYLIAGLMLAVILAGFTTAGFAADSGSNAVVSGLVQVIKAPLTIMEKASNALSEAPGSSGDSEDVVVGPIYDLDAETTG